MKKLGAVLAATALLTVAGCSSDDGDDASPGTTQPGPVTLNVSAAASLKNTFTAIAGEFEKQHDGVSVALSFDGSSTLVNQIKQGAPADVFASADEKNMNKLGDQATDPKIFATNTLVIVTAPGNPKGIASFADLNKEGVTTVVCQSAQPCGNATGTVEANTGVTIKAASEEQSVTAVLTKVTTGQADAGLVYVTDAKAAGDKVATVDDPAFADVVNKYPIATVSGAANDALGKEFIELVTGAEGQKILGDAGFGKP
ncbi:molybdate ABC transporter substrate-binding protein [Gordonia pseudamarae]|uniref:Molybdate ABC transporter substrate-binding protein n=1 Tax=Gordonia pseudamarae TaxID=2831662 RepID=A0ABX6ICU9_9ACTN|nr:MULTISPECIES: molybdate ABC transporter substrate-binding protein [Gordonia]MBD0024577.1 molybdate ABC transporter substrate-binding protein [Gordonia sp. (in: high G+C Gram-positive bacteria)]QHN24829.1 molybdate ABC transporter substrate-binding protein [Gordonia pseudamarae]QHN33762.1 molybdate ABC transporter substrate-binding protein [Gordonia pseudamarae]